MRNKRASYNEVEPRGIGGIRWKQNAGTGNNNNKQSNYIHTTCSIWTSCRLSHTPY